MRNIKNKQSGFTLIELVLVISVLGVLSITALPNLFELNLSFLAKGNYFIHFQSKGVSTTKKLLKY